MYGASCLSAKENCHRVSKMRGATLANGNRPFDAWTETFKSERLTGAILDRLTHHVSILNMNGESYHLSQSNASQATSETKPPIRTDWPGPANAYGQSPAA
jgi:hypothetical protein